ncbi:MAG: cupin domain-containing protein [Candidatus Omnitrophica bacterium]|nr:cupin domain-containing protein [Candidatus Omnitrophota bacterium]
MKIGGRVRQLRQESGLTLEELSNKSGIALASLSRMENDKMVGTLESHMKICKAIGITLSKLYTGLEREKKDIDLHKGKQDAEVFVHNKTSSSELLTSKVLDKKMMPIMLKIKPNGATTKEENKIGTEKFIYVLDGELEIEIGNEKYSLSKDDSLYFNASLPHTFRNTGKTEVRCICTATPPVL